jgi:hypothetical protein
MKNQNFYRIENSVSGHVFGTYLASSAQAAYDLLREEVAAEKEEIPEEISVKEVEFFGSETETYAVIGGKVRFF